MKKTHMKFEVMREGEPSLKRDPLLTNLLMSYRFIEVNVRG